MRGTFRVYGVALADSESGSDTRRRISAAYGIIDTWRKQPVDSAVPPWCNGSTRVFGTLCLGSSPGGGARIGTSVGMRESFFIFLKMYVHFMGFFHMGVREPVISISDTGAFWLRESNRFDRMNVYRVMPAHGRLSVPVPLYQEKGTIYDWRKHIFHGYQN